MFTQFVFAICVAGADVADGAHDMFDELPDKTTSPPQLSVQPMVTVPSTDTNTDVFPDGF